MFTNEKIEKLCYIKIIPKASFKNPTWMQNMYYYESIDLNKTNTLVGKYYDEYLVHILQYTREDT